MSDLISRQAAIDYVDDVPYIKDHPNIGLLWKAWVEQLPSAQPEQQWIPATERLPEKKQEVIVTVTRKNGSIFTERDGWTGTGFWGYGHRVIAWMPLPEPYKSESEG